MEKIRFSTNKSDTFLAYIVKKWYEFTKKGVGRIQLQKLCYFSKAKGIPLSFEFKLYHYGPFSQEIYDNTDSLILDGILVDNEVKSGRSEYIPGDSMEEFINQNSRDIEKYTSDLDFVVEQLEGLSPQRFELISTIHYSYRAKKDYYGQEPTKNEVITSSLKAKKGKYPKELIEDVYNLLQENGLLGWGIV